jgi:hypothetical protein
MIGFIQILVFFFYINISSELSRIMTPAVQWYTSIEVLHADHKDSCGTDATAPENKMTSHFPSSSHTYNLNTASRW